jgi:SAM-dependent methyltransferase
MQADQYRFMFEAEDHHWWYVGNHEIFLTILKGEKILKNGIKVLDAGCGTGRWLQVLKESCEIYETGVDNREIALNYSGTRGEMNLVLGDINSCLFNQSSFDLITSFDVIYHRDVDDDLAVKNFHSYLKKDGYLLLTVPAYSFLYSKHDAVVFTKRRYTKKEIKSLLEKNGFEIVKLSYCVSLLFPFALIKRLIDKISPDKKEIHNEIKIPSWVVNQLFLLIMRFENYLLKSISFPFGLSLLALVKKRSSANTHQPSI